MVQPSAQLNSISVAPQSLNFNIPSQMAGLVVLGNYSDGIQRDITSTNAGTPYTTASGSNLVVSLGANGAVTAISNGQDSIIIANSLVSTSVVVNVQISNYPPILNAISNQSLAASSTLTVPIQAVDPMGNAIKFSKNSLPDFVTLTDNGNGRASLLLAPGTNDVGVSSVTIIATDNGTPSLGAMTTFTITVTPTSVSDGIPSMWRAQYFGGNGTTTNNQSCATCDPDGDGMNNLQEYLAGTVPTNSASYFHITSVVQTNTNLLISWMTGIGRTNALQVSAGTGGSYTTNFADIFTVTNTVGTTTNYLDAGAATNRPARYYRVRLVP